MRIAVLGGGMGGVTAAWHLTQQGHAVTVYQRGWRLGGKGASGRNAATAQRIEEHGLHVLMGFYETAFGVLKDVYATAHQVPPGPNGQPMPFTQAFRGWQTCVFSRQRQDGTWTFFPVEFPSKPGTAPWDGPHPSSDFVALFRAGLAVLDQTHGALKPVTGNSLLHAVVDGAITSLANLVGGVANGLRHALLTGLETTLTPVLAALFAAVKSDREEWLLLAFCFVLGNALGMLRDGLIEPSPDFDRINDIDYRDWLGSALAKIGCPRWASYDSPFVTALYDLAFSRERTLAAGVTLKTILLMGLKYRGDVAFKMTAGMGDIVFAPFYLALERLGVQIAFFHRVTALRLDAGKRYVDAIELERQVDTPGGYDPLVDVGGLACWPHEPKTALLAPPYQVDYANAGNRMPYDFEKDPGPSPYRMDAQPYRLVCGTDFDAVVLAIPVGALSGICADLMTPGSPFDAMVRGLATMRTVALQVWLGCDFQHLKSPAPKGMVISYKRPFNSWADMSQVLPWERWSPPPPVRDLAYFCDALPDAVADPDAAAWVTKAADQWLQHDVADLWPGYVHATDTVSRYERVNVDPSERYVLTEAGTTGKRLDAGASGFVNLALAGDWVKTHLNSGCLEAAALGGVAAAEAIRTRQVTACGGGKTGMPTYVERDGDWVLRPPGRLEHVAMHLFALRAGAAELQALCDKFINVPTGNAVRATPLFPGFPFVLVTCADISKGFSEDPEDAERGWMSESDVGFFVPVNLEWNGQKRVANLLPYLYVDNFAAVLIGREVFGFPKVLADITFGAFPWKCTVTSTVSVTANPAQPAGPGVILTALRHASLPGMPIPGKLDDALAFIIDVLRTALGLPKEAHVPFATIPMVFLKEFRDATQRTRACHQSVVLAEAGIDAFYGGELWPSLPVPLPGAHPFSFTIPAYHSVDIAKHLGLGAGPNFHPLLSARVAIDFALPFGTTLWTAP